MLKYKHIIANNYIKNTQGEWLSNSHKKLYKS